ncbi:MAG TPA: HAMP domain-containing histidine kinase, partial [Phycisphaerales bacterium]|nr:HAMP domain-containing histidine kinase [Phycisphaerales bacterium]
MRRRRLIAWIVYAVCVLLVADVLGWATLRVLALERAERAASAEADAVQRERLALWQMDSFVSALISRESARPYFEYRARYAADLPYGRAWDVGRARAVVRSPLAVGDSGSLIRLHYQVEPDGRVTSPQLDPEVVTPGTETIRAGMLLRELTSISGFDAPLQVEQTGAGRDADMDAGTTGGRATPPGDSGAEDFTDADLRRQLFDLARSGVAAPAEGERGEGVDDVGVGVFRPRWLIDPTREPELVFERDVWVDGEAYRQGIWLDWPALRADLLALAVRLVPGARLEPVAGGESESMLATVPARLLADAPESPVPAWTPIRVTLAVTWFASLVALVAIGLVLGASMSLADRRGRFIAAVSHELRSPLTSFRLSTDLLARAEDEDARRAHIETLRAESRRLEGVVENVLAYAGLQHGAGRADDVSVREILGPLLPALERRCGEAGVTFGHEFTDDAADAVVRVRTGAVEQIVSNLVDNACRYGAQEGGGAVRLRVSRESDSVRIVVADNGPGVPADERKRIFGAFSRGTRSTRSHRGVGLGLALSRGLARADGGELRLVDS